MKDTSKLPRWPETTTRLLEDSERPVRTGTEAAPLIIEPNGARDSAFLRQFLARHSSDVKRALYDYGAVLFRGFDVRSDRAFEECLLSISGFRAMNGYFMSEPGRDRAAGTRSVFHTNTRYKTGGSFRIGGFHSENYYSTDVPQFQSFWCKKQPWHGGETALVNMAAAYAGLRESHKSQLESSAACSDAWLVSDIAKRYSISETAVERFCGRVGLPLLTHENRRFVVLQKPNIYVHPFNKKRSLQVNLSSEIHGLDDAVRKLLLPHYSGWKWALHRLAWKHGWLATLLVALEYMPTVISHPSLILELIAMLVARISSRPIPRGPSLPRLADAAGALDVDELAEAILAHTLTFSWERDDILIFDNCQMLHSGMPGLGPRELRVMMFNPVPLRFPMTSGVLEVIDDEPHYESIDVRMRRLHSEASQPPL